MKIDFLLYVILYMYLVVIVDHCVYGHAGIIYLYIGRLLVVIIDQDGVCP